MCSGCRRASTPNSSIMTTNRGSVSSVDTSSEMSRTWALRNTRSRRWISTFSPLSIRSMSSLSRSLTTAATCGSSLNSSKVDPPLKSMSTRCNAVLEYFRHREVIKVRRNSLFPEPVVPATNMCGPSRTRSSSIGPVTDTPMRTFSELSDCRGTSPRLTISGRPSTELS